MACQVWLLVSSHWVQGAFQVTTQQPINYTIEEVEGLLDPANKVISDPPPWLSMMQFTYPPTRSARLFTHLIVQVCVYTLVLYLQSSIAFCLRRRHKWTALRCCHEWTARNPIPV